MKNFDAAREALSDMPPRSESELDPVTLHNQVWGCGGGREASVSSVILLNRNQGLLAMDTEPNSGFKKLNFLLSQPPFPNETFSNLVILYCKYMPQPPTSEPLCSSNPPSPQTHHPTPLTPNFPYPSTKL